LRDLGVLIRQQVPQRVDAPEEQHRCPSYRKRQDYLAQFDQYWKSFQDKRYDEARGCFEYLLLSDVMDKAKDRPAAEKLHFLLYSIFHGLDVGKPDISELAYGPALKAIQTYDPDQVIHMAQQLFWPHQIRPLSRDGAHYWTILGERKENPKNVMVIGVDRQYENNRIHMIHLYDTIPLRY